MEISSRNATKDKNNITGWNISFKPDIALFKTGNDPLRLFKQLKSLGVVTVSADDAALPDFDLLDPLACYLTWTIKVVSDNGIPLSELKEIFEWIEDEFQPGFYLGFNSTTGPLYNTFNRHSTFVQGGNNIPFFGPTLIDTFILPYNFNEKDDSIVLAVFDLSGPTPVSDSLYYYPVEIQILQDTDTTPIILSGTVESSFPITLTSIDLRCNGNYIQSLYGDGTVNDMSELIIYLNSEPDMSYLGTYSDAGDGGVLLEMPTNLVNQFCSNGTLTFEVFND